MLDYPPGYEIDGNTITPGGMSAVMAVTRPRGCRLRCCLRCRLRCCPRCRLDRGTRAGSGGRRRGRGARSLAGATVRRRERAPFRPYVGTVGPALEGRRGRTAYGPCAGIRTGPVRCGGGVPSGRNGAAGGQAGRRAGRGGSGAFRRETAGSGRRDTGRPVGGGWNPTRARTTGARSGGAVALPSPRPAVAGSPSAPARRLGPTAACAPAASAAPVRSRLSPQSPQPAARSRPPPQPQPPTRSRPLSPPAPARAQCPLSPPRVPSAGR
ncbi:hypothetical protein J2S51_003628 [Streptomyces sp. DSM 41269]|nr:hypothetical protein [Streptomyces sp. DSM 41269]